MNDYGQIAESSLGDAVDFLLEALTIYAYGPYERPAEEPVPVVDGLVVAQHARHNPQHQVSTSGLSIVNPAFAAEKRSLEKRLWKEIRRGYDRLKDLSDGKCLSCYAANDQRHKRVCSLCEKKYSERA